MLRQEFVDALVNQLKGIKKEDGYLSDAGHNVFEWLDKPLEDREYPAIIVRDVSDTVVDNQQLKHTLRIEVDIAVKGKQSPWNMREVSSDVLKVLKVFEHAQNRITRYIGSEFLVEHKESQYGGVRMEIDLDYYTPRWEQ